MDNRFESLLVCPVCHTELSRDRTHYICQSNICKQEFPLIGQIPIFVTEIISTFTASAYRDDNRTRSWNVKKHLRSLVPRISGNLVASKNIGEVRNLILSDTPRPLVLVVGGAEIGAGMCGLLRDERIKCLESDIVIGTRTEIVFDASYMPLKAGSVDGVIIQAVLEYIPDPAQTVAEIYRVLKPGGIVYSEMPFLQNVHGGRYDFTRLTHLGHLRLYRQFTEIQSGACAGPATALAWSLQHFFLSFVKAPWQRDLTKVGTGLLFFWLKYFDYLLAGTPGCLDAATGTFLLARKSDRILPDRELIAKYRGAVPATEIL